MPHNNLKRKDAHKPCAQLFRALQDVFTLAQIYIPGVSPYIMNIAFHHHLDDAEEVVIYYARSEEDNKRRKLSILVSECPFDIVTPPKAREEVASSRNSNHR